VERVGFVGTGIMGAPMARNALKAGFAVTVTNRTLTRAEPLAKDGATVVKTPREVAARSDIVVTMVVDSPDVETVLFGPDGVAAGAHDGLLAIDMSTISPVRTKEFAERAAKNRPPFKTLDAPVSGGEIGAIEARLSIMIGGDAPDVERLYGGRCCKATRDRALCGNRIGFARRLADGATAELTMARHGNS